MRRITPWVLAVVGAMGLGAFIRAQSVPTATHHTIASPAAIAWKPGSPQMPAGAMVAVIHGDPAKAGDSYVLRLKLPDGTKVAPHWHPGDEHLTVLQGTFLVGMGEKFDAAQFKTLEPGAFAFMPKKTPHFAATKGDTIVQLHGVGPFSLTYVNPADDPSLKKTSSY